MSFVDDELRKYKGNEAAEEKKMSQIKAVEGEIDRIIKSVRNNATRAAKEGVNYVKYVYSCSDIDHYEKIERFTALEAPLLERLKKEGYINIRVSPKIERRKYQDNMYKPIWYEILEGIVNLFLKDEYLAGIEIIVHW